MKNLLTYEQYLTEMFLNEIEFSSKEEFLQYKKEHNMRPDTVVKINGKDSKVSDVKDDEDDKKSSVFDLAAALKKKKITTIAYKNSKGSMNYILKKKNSYFEYSQERKKWEEVVIPNWRREEIEKEEKSPEEFSKQIKDAGIDTTSIESTLKLRDITPEENSKSKRKEEAKKYDYKEKTKYEPLEVRKVDNEVYNKVNKNPDVKEFLNYLIHSKENVMDNNKKVPELEEVLSKCKNVVNDKPLYRGMYNVKPSDFKVGETMEMGRYQSFSEDDGVSKDFAVDSGVIIQLDKSKGSFNYGGWVQNELESAKKAEDKQVLNLARYEKEHIFSRDAKMKITKIEKRGDFTYVIAEME